MNDKHYLLKYSIIALLLLSNFTYAQDFVVDFSEAEGYGVSADQIQINQIGVKWFGPFDPEGVLIPYNLLFQVCQSNSGRLYLRPILTEEQPLCQEIAYQADFSNSYGKSIGVDGIQIENIGIKTFDPNIPDHPGIITSFQNLTFKFDSDTLDLEECQVCILLTWRDDRLEFDAHLTGPAPGIAEDYNHEADRFHLYFGSPYHEVSELKRANELGQKQQVFIFPPNLANTLLPGIYRYSVHHFGNNNQIANSGVQVRLWIAGEPEQVFTPPYQSNPVGSADGFEDEGFENDKMGVWVVFELHVAEDGQIMVWQLQRYDIDVSPPEVRSCAR